MYFEFVWKIENYSAVLHDLDEELRSPIFYADPISKIQWFLTIEYLLQSSTDNKNNYISCFLNRDNDGGIDEPVTIDFIIEAIGPDERVFYSHPYENCHFLKGDTNGSKCFAKVSDITYILSNMSNNTLIIRCTLIIAQLPLLTQNKYIINTNICMDIHSFPWSLKYSKGQEWSAKRKFYIPEQTSLEVTVCTINDNILITITRAQELPCVSQYITCCIQWLDYKGKLVFIDNYSYLFSCKKINDIWKFPTSQTARKLLNLACCYTRLKLNLVLCFFVSNGIIINTNNEIRYTHPCLYATYYLQQFSPLFLDFKALCVNRTTCDVRLRVGYRVFPAHLVVLCVRVPAFARFLGEMICKNSIEIEVPNVNEFIFKTFLSYVYTGKVNLIENINDIFDLLEFVDTYDVELLESKCVTYLIGILTKENVFEIFIGATRAHCDILQDEIYSFVRKHLDLFKSPQWQNLSRNHIVLAHLILQNVDNYVPC